MNETTASTSARFILDAMRCGFALTPFNHSNEMIGPTRIFDSDGRIMAEVGEADEVEEPEE